MGKAHSGKTSMRSIIFANYLARDTTRLSPTLDVEHHHVRFLGDLVLNLWDCGGQDAFYESYFERDRETIFRSVELLIYVFDIESDTAEKDFDHFCGVLEAIEENSPDARIFVLVHKMDLVAEDDRDLILDERKTLIAETCTNCGVEHFQCYGTSIWDETLYKAWSEIVTNLIPNISLLETHLQKFCRICDADEVVLFERATFLVISHAQANDEDDDDDNHAYNDNNKYNDNMIVGSDNNAASNSTNSATAVDNGGGIIPSSSMDVGADDQDDSILQNDDVGNNIPGSPKIDTSNQVGSIISSGTTNLNIGTGNDIMNTTHRMFPKKQMVAVKHIKRIPHFDAHRFEKISNIVKQFKLSCGKAQSQFQGMEVRNSRFCAFIDAFTANTYIMVIVSNPAVHTAATILNIQNAREHFEKFIPRI